MVRGLWRRPAEFAESGTVRRRSSYKLAPFVDRDLTQWHTTESRTGVPDDSRVGWRNHGNPTHNLHV